MIHLLKQKRIRGKALIFNIEGLVKQGQRNFTNGFFGFGGVEEPIRFEITK